MIFTFFCCCRKCEVTGGCDCDPVTKFQTDTVLNSMARLKESSTGTVFPNLTSGAECGLSAVRGQLVAVNFRFR